MGRGQESGTPLSSQIVWLEQRVEHLEAENEKLFDAIHGYMQTTDQCGDKETLVKNFINGYYIKK